jgi:hypothetical protein
MIVGGSYCLGNLILNIASLQCAELDCTGFTGFAKWCVKNEGSRHHYCQCGGELLDMRPSPSLLVKRARFVGKDCPSITTLRTESLMTTLTFTASTLKGCKLEADASVSDGWEVSLLRLGVQNAEPLSKGVKLTAKAVSSLKPQLDWSREHPSSVPGSKVADIPGIMDIIKSFVTSPTMSMVGKINGPLLCNFYTEMYLRRASRNSTYTDADVA